MLVLAVIALILVKHSLLGMLETETWDPDYHLNSYLFSFKILWFSFKSNRKIMYSFLLSFSLLAMVVILWCWMRRRLVSLSEPFSIREPIIINYFPIVFQYSFLNVIQEDSTRTGDQKRLNLWFIPVEISRLFMVDLFRTE